MTRAMLVQLMTIILGLIALVIVVLSWQVLGVAVEKRRWLNRLYRLVTMVVVVALLSGVVIFVLLGGDVEMLRTMLGV